MEHVDKGLVNLKFVRTPIRTESDLISMDVGETADFANISLVYAKRRARRHILVGRDETGLSEYCVDGTKLPLVPESKTSELVELTSENCDISLLGEGDPNHDKYDEMLRRRGK